MRRLNASKAIGHHEGIQDTEKGNLASLYAHRDAKRVNMSSRRQATSQSNVIVLIDSSDDDDNHASDGEASEEEELVERRVASKAKAKPSQQKNKDKKKKKKKSSVVYGDYVLSREEQMLNGLAPSDEDDESADDEDEYDDRDASYGADGRAFARARGRPTTFSLSIKSTKLTTKKRLAVNVNAQRRATSSGKKRARGSDSESESANSNPDSGSEYKHSNMVRRMAEAREKRAQLAAQARRSDAHGVNKTKPVVQAEVRIASSSKAVMKTPMTARKSAPMAKQVMRPSKRPRREDEEDYEMEEEDDDDDEDEEESEEEEEVVRRQATRRRAKSESEEEEEEEEESESGSESDGFEHEQQYSPSPKKTKKSVRSSAASAKATARKTEVRRSRSPSPSPPRQTKVSSIPVRAPQKPKPVVSASSSSRPSRGVQSLSEKMSIQEMQAQERELAFFKSQQKKKVYASDSSDEAEFDQRSLPPSPSPKKTKKKAHAHAAAAVTTAAPMKVTARKTVVRQDTNSVAARLPRSPSPSPPQSPQQIARPPASQHHHRPPPKPVATAPSRSSRAAESLSEKMSLQEIQAQEREWAYFKAQLKKKEQPHQDPSASNAKSANSGSSSSQRASASSSRVMNAARKAAPPSNRLQRQDSATSITSSVASLASREPAKPLTKKHTNIPLSFVPPPLRDGFPTTHTPNVVTSVTSAMEASMTIVDNIEHLPIAHNTSWRRLRFSRAPMNLLPASSSSRTGHGCILPFSSVEERELHEYDESGELTSKTDLVLQETHVTTEHVLNQIDESTESVNAKVGAVVNDTLPKLKDCHKRRAQAIIDEMRSQLPWHKSRRAPPTHSTTRRQLGESVPEAATEISPIEQVHAKRMQLKMARPRGSPNELNRLVGHVRVIEGIPIDTQEDSGVVFERVVYPETVIEFGEDLAPMRRSCTWVSVKTNFHVDDEPILRYIPHLGDKAFVNIDPKRYQSTTLDKDERIVVEIDGEDETNGDDDDDLSSSVGGRLTASERLDQWREDVANLKVETIKTTDDDVMEYLLCKVIKECGKSDKVFQALKQIAGFTQPSSDYDQIQKRVRTMHVLENRLAAFRKCLASSSEQTNSNDSSDNKSSSNSDPRVREYLLRLAAGATRLPLDAVGGGDVPRQPKTVSHRLDVPLQPFDSNYVRYPEGKGLRRNAESVRDAMGSYRELFCRRCYSYDCEKHGVDHPQPYRRMDPVNPVVRKAGVGLARAATKSDDKTKSPTSDVIEIDASVSSSSDDESDLENGNEDVASEMSGSVDGGDGDTAAEAADRRRSRRSQTKASTMASASLKVQEVMVEKERRKQQRQQVKQLQKLVRPVDDSEYLDDSYREIVGPVMDVLLSSSPDTFCSDHCWKRHASSAEPESESQSNDEDTQLSQVDELLLRKLMALLGDNACVMTALLRDPSPSPSPPSGACSSTSNSASCRAVRRFIQQQKGTSQSLADASTSLGHDHRFQNKPGHRRPHQHQHRSSATLHSGNSELVKRTRMHRVQQQQDKTREHCYKPCDHDGGVCDASCDCMKRGHDCESACSCSRDCANRNHGCKCSPGQCRTKNCSCYALNRECHPDFCFSCGAHEAAVMEYDERLKHTSAETVDICRNVSLLRGVHKKIGVAFSATHGWGAYVLEPVRKGEFVYEYTGALISDDEAERRGNIYDAMLVSYLFDVNSDEVVDAMRKGNKIKFANHMPQKTANLETKILVVRGEHRIAMFAKWDLHVGEELFFDYGYTNEMAPEWSQERAPHNIHYTGSDVEDEEEDEDDEDLVVLGVRRADDGDEDDGDL